MIKAAPVSLHGVIIAPAATKYNRNVALLTDY